MAIPSKTDFLRGVRKFDEMEPRDPVYRVSADCLHRAWGEPAEMADALTVLLLIWNQAFYRFGPFDEANLATYIKKNHKALTQFRKREIFGLSGADEPKIKALFKDFLEATRIVSGKKKGAKSPVAVAKSLHLLAPAFFPLWDYAIAKRYGYNYYTKPAEKYLNFCEDMRGMAEKVKGYVGQKELNGRTLLKLMDMYNYVYFSKAWLKKSTSKRKPDRI